MQASNAPSKSAVPFAESGTKNTIPVASQIGVTPGLASFTDGFPPLTMTPLAAGGVPPYGADFNGILNFLSAAVRWAQAGGGYPYDAAFATDSNVGGYPKGARIMRSDGLGYWFNTVENNTTDPEAAGAAAAGWVPDFTDGVTSVAMASANVTLTPLQYGKPIIVITGTLTANLNLIFPNLAGEWTVVNNCTGAFTVTAKTAAGTGVTLTSGGKIRIVFGDGTNVYSAMNASDTPPQFDNDTSLATTAFVQRALGNMQASRAVAAGSTSLVLGDVGKTVNVTGVSAATITLPQGAGIPDGSKLEFFVSNTSSVTISPYGADTIYVNSGLVANIVLYAGDSLTLVWIGNTWIVVAGSAQLQYSTGRFGYSIAASGYQKLPSGLIIQWGSATTNAAGAVTVSYPIAFPNAVVSLVASGTNSNVVSTAFINVNPISVSQATFYAANTSVGIAYGISYIAIGY